MGAGRSRARTASRRAVQLRYRWNGISKNAANTRANTSDTGTATASVTQNAGNPGATCGATNLRAMMTTIGACTR